MSLAVNVGAAGQVASLEAAAGSPVDSLVALIQRAYVHQYTEARHQYKAAHARFTARVTRPPPSWVEKYSAAAYRDLSSYTSAAAVDESCAPSTCPHGPRRIAMHTLNHELRLRGEERLAATPVKPKRSAEDLVALLVAQEAAEYADILELQAAEFLLVARTYYKEMIEPVDNFVWLEEQTRRCLEDEYAADTVAFLAEMREEIWLAHQRLFLRALNVCPEVLPHLSQQRLLADAPREVVADKDIVLDSRVAVPLWHRVCAIRGETESEEDIDFRRMLLANFVEEHAISDGYLRRNTATGNLQHGWREVPACMRDAIEYAMQFEVFAAVLNEETQRMRVIEEAEAEFAAIVAGAEGAHDTFVAAIAGPPGRPGTA